MWFTIFFGMNSHHSYMKNLWKNGRNKFYMRKENVMQVGL